ncbi:MAG: hypothetical protein ACI4TF_14720 [Oliverpabstia sp.]
MNQDIKILRELANQYAQIAAENNEKNVWNLHACLNDLHPIRPVVLIDELPWHELNVDGFLTLQCQEPLFRDAEDFMRKTIFRHKYFPGDMLVKPYLPVQKIIHTTGIGVEVKEETLATDRDNAVVSHKYENQFESIEDVEKLHNEIITYDEKSSMKRYEMLCEAVGDIIPVKLVGEPTGYGLGHRAWDIISTYMSVDNLLYNLVDEPEMMHALVEKLTNIFLDTVRQYEELNLLDPDSAYCHSSSAASRDLLKEPVDYQHVKAKNVWGRGLAQILATVSPAMHEEFEIEYAKKAMAPFGLVYYGCCEPLDTKIDIVKKIPNLRKISITPWADINRAAEAVGKDYVISAKPNPANLPYAASNPEMIRQEIKTLIKACEKNGTPCEILLKDISTAGNNLENLIVWNRIAKEEAIG